MNNQVSSTSTDYETPEFLLTKEYQRFAEFCDACHRERYIGICYGSPGVGKTLSARHYAKWSLLEPILKSDLIQFEPTRKQAFDLRFCRTVFYTPSVVHTPGAIHKQIRGVCDDFNYIIASADRLDRDNPNSFHTENCELLIIDEADRLKTSSLEQVRDIYDREKIGGLVLIGMPGLEKRLARYPQLYSRVGFAHHFRSLSKAEVYYLIEHHCKQLGANFGYDDLADTEVLAAIVRITNGNFRLINRLLQQVNRILQINKLSSINQEVIHAARECLVIGAL